MEIEAGASQFKIDRTIPISENISSVYLDAAEITGNSAFVYVGKGSRAGAASAKRRAASLTEMPNPFNRGSPELPIHLSDVLVVQLTRLEIEQHEALEQIVVKNQVDVEIFGL